MASLSLAPVTALGTKAWVATAVSATGQYVVAIANDNNIYVSNDYGASFSTVAVSGSHIWMGICINTTGQYIFAASYGDDIYVSSNYGSSFTASSGISSGSWTSVSCNATATMVVAVNSSGSNKVYLSTNNGVSWAPPAGVSDPSTMVPSRCCVNLAGNRILVGSNNGTGVFVLNTAVPSWTHPSTLNTAPEFCNGASMEKNGVHMIAAFKGSGSNPGDIFYSSDSGATWSQPIVPTPGSTQQWGATAHDYAGGAFLAAVYGGSIYSSTNNGATFSVVDTNAREWNWLGVSTGNSIIAATVNNEYLYIAGSAPVPCFLEGSQILCLVDGSETYVAIEDMKAGTLVKTSRDGFKRVVGLGHKTLHNPGHSRRVEQRLYKCSPAAYPTLKEDLYLTGGHSILVPSITEAQRAQITKHLGRIFFTDGKYRLTALADDRAEPWASEGSYTVWHVSLENENVYANYGIYVNGGLLVETCSINYLRNRSHMRLLE